MNSKDRVRAAISFNNPDKVPVDYAAASCVTEELLKHFGCANFKELVGKLNIDIVEITPKYIGPELKTYYDSGGHRVEQSWWGYENTYYKTGNREYGVVSHYPLNNMNSITDIKNYNWPNPDWFDYESIKKQCNEYPDKSIVVGSAGPFQYVTFLVEMSALFMDMVENEEKVHCILNKMVEFELEYYQRLLEAADGQIDIIRPCDDYGSQINLFFSKEMWSTFFRDNTIKLVDLVHRNKALYMQHSCGAVEPLINEFIQCKVDALDPIQKVVGLEPENLWRRHGGKIAFHGGIDTQELLPFGSTIDVINEIKHYIGCLHHNGGYILMASQSFEPDIPTDNIVAIYTTDRD